MVERHCPTVACGAIRSRYDSLTPAVASKCRTKRCTERRSRHAARKFGSREEAAIGELIVRIHETRGNHCYSSRIVRDCLRLGLLLPSAAFQNTKHISGF